MRDTIALTASESELIQNIHQKIQADPKNLTYPLDLIREIYYLNKFFAALFLLDKYEADHMSKESYELRLQICNELMSRFDPEKAPEKFQERMQNLFTPLKEGFPDAMYTDGEKAFNIYVAFNKNGIEDIAYYFLLKAGKLSHSKAEAELGIKYYIGDYFSKNEKEAFSWTLKSAMQNNRIGLNNLGTFYFDGTGTEINYERAYTFLMQAYEMGTSVSLGEIGYCLYFGKGVTMNTERAYQLWTKGSELKAVGCEHYLNLYFPKGKEN